MGLWLSTLTQHLLQHLRSDKRALYSDKRARYSNERALYCDQTDLYTGNELCVMTREPCTRDYDWALWRSTFTNARGVTKEPCIPTKEPYILTKEPYMLETILWSAACELCHTSMSHVSCMNEQYIYIYIFFWKVPSDEDRKPRTTDDMAKEALHLRTLFETWLIQMGNDSLMYQMLTYRVAKTNGMPYLYRSFSTKEPYNWRLFCGKGPAT